MRKQLMRGAASGALMLMMVPSVAMLGCSGTPAAGDDAADAGAAFTGKGEGKGGTIEVTLTVDNGRIVSVDEIIGEKESPNHGQVPIEDGTFAEQIMEAQSADIDGVSGSTLTTKGVKEAVQDALDQAADAQGSSASADAGQK